mmetsp:Transcript_12114/g.15845  ORF Transcript_12114/g.15845 Transcript_12114/m.15845 type:complete len:756 (-) Transcript_12114:255-2522(-)|eukprot:CAMPEP_0117776048 /NCGR_PEP_ID=MMETSP0947-20121206/27519_1 /TAXON_ID=44440 /ORGANISM="Chattonella subsalsa, Strain CCMP2191" /LENGTH=755 /DNA_ID=CAMNT_0005602907 /DNA_START=185 /DNA_END=2452 /DNA_ORIENTATION=-
MAKENELNEEVSANFSQNNQVSLNRGNQVTVLAATIVLVFLAFGTALFCELSLLGANKAQEFQILILTTNLVSTLVYFLLVPLTHLSGYLCHQKWKLFQPFSGGSRFILFQALAWSLYALSLVLSLLWLFKFGFVAKQAFGWITFSGATGVLSQVFMISSLLVFEGTATPRQVKQKPEISGSSKGTLESDGSVHHQFFSMHLLLAFSALILSVASEYAYWLDQKEFALLCAVLSSAKYIVANFNSYGLGGRLLHIKKSGWTFWQPFSGGSRFVALQAASWTTFAASLILQLGFIMQSLVLGLQCIAGITALAGLLCMSSQLLLVVSLPAFDKKNGSEKMFKIPQWLERLALFAFVGIMMNVPFAPMVLGIFVSLVTRLSFYQALFHGFIFFCYCSTVTQVGFGAWKVLLSKEWKEHQRQRQKKSKLDQQTALYNPMELCRRFITVSFLCILLALPLGYLYHLHQKSDPSWRTWLILNVLFYPYISTYLSEPEVTGAREIPIDHSYSRSLQIPTLIADLWQKHFHGKIIKTAELDGNGQYILAMHPHGVLPLTLTWLRYSAEWHAKFNGLQFSVLAATCVHMVPALRDILQWLGAREVSKQSFLNALKKGKSTLVIPGGQEEISYSRSQDDKFRLVTRHKGFLRLAMQHGVPVVPILSFGENDFLDAVQMPLLQRWFIKKCGVFVPYFPYGTMGLPVPRSSPVTIVVGSPIQIKQIPEPNKDQVQELADKYYTEIKRLFEEYKEKAGYGCKDLVLT